MSRGGVSWADPKGGAVGSPASPPRPAVRPLADLGAARTYVDGIGAGWRERRLFQRAVTADDDRLVGTLTLVDGDRGHRRAEVGSMLHPAWAGRGLATDAVRTALRFAVDEMDLHRVEAGTDPETPGGEGTAEPTRRRSASSMGSGSGARASSASGSSRSGRGGTAPSSASSPPTSWAGRMRAGRTRRARRPRSAPAPVPRTTSTRRTDPRRSRRTTGTSTAWRPARRR